MTICTRRHLPRWVNCSKSKDTTHEKKQRFLGSGLATLQYKRSSRACNEPQNRQSAYQVRPQQSILQRHSKLPQRREPILSSRNWERKHSKLCHFSELELGFTLWKPRHLKAILEQLFLKA